MKRILLLVGLWLAVACAFATAVSAALLANPGFESGDLSGWSTIDAGAGAWAVNDGSELPGSEYTLAPAEGRYDAAWDMEFVSGGVLYQDVAVPAAGGGVSFSYAYVNDADGWAMTPGEEFNLGEDNQWISIDVLADGADPRSFDAEDVLTTVFRPSEDAPLSSDWHTASVDLTPWSGKTVRLRFGVVDTHSYLPLWVDGVRPAAGPAPKPNIGHMGYCAVEGNTWPDGSPIQPGTFLNLVAGQPKTDVHYTGAQPANFIQGRGITCDPPPAGYVQQGFATEDMHVPGGVYPYWVPGA